MINFKSKDFIHWQGTNTTKALKITNVLLVLLSRYMQLQNIITTNYEYIKHGESVTGLAIKMLNAMAKYQCTMEINYLSVTRLTTKMCEMTKYHHNKTTSKQYYLNDECQQRECNGKIPNQDRQNNHCVTEKTTSTTTMPKC